LGCSVKIKSFGGTRRKHVDDESEKSVEKNDLVERSQNCE